MPIGLVLDSGDPEALAPFWAGALGYVVAGSVDNYVLLRPDGDDGPKLLLQRVPEAKSTKNRMHLDIETTDIEGLVSRLLALGGSRVEDGVHEEHSCCWVVMADPEGNEFCVCCPVQP
ncbi:MAG TPA: VOC family protein [Acidimicrobiales bacterium]